MQKLIATSIRRTKYSVHCTKACLIIFLMSFNFTYFFLISFPISCCIHRMLELTGLIQFWDWIGLGPQGSKLFWGGLGPQGPKCSFFDVLQFHIFFFLFHFQFPFAYTAPDAGANRFDPVLGLNRDLRTQNCFWADQALRVQNVFLGSEVDPGFGVGSGQILSVQNWVGSQMGLA